MKGLARVLQLSAGLSVGACLLVLWVYGQLQGGGGSPLSPEIVGVDLWPVIPADGSKTFGAVRFRDADGDIVQARFDVVEALDFAPFSEAVTLITVLGKWGTRGTGVGNFSCSGAGAARATASSRDRWGLP